MEQSNGESRSSGIGEGAQVKQSRRSKKDGSSGESAEMNPPVIEVVSIVAADWLPEKFKGGSEDMDAKNNYPECVEATEKQGFVYNGREPKNQDLEDLLAVPPVDESVLVTLIITAHTSYTQDGPKKPLKEFLSLSDTGKLSKITFKAVVKSLAKVSEKRQFDLIILACCQGHKLAKKILEKGLVNECIVFFGSKGERKEDGVHAFLAQDLVEKGLEMFSDAVRAGETKLSGVEMMKKLYIRLGEEYVYPDELKLLQTPGGDYEYARYELTKSMLDTEGSPDYVKDHVFGGKLGILTFEGENLVTEELKKQREEFMAQKKAEVESLHKETVSKRARAE